MKRIKFFKPGARVVLKKDPKSPVMEVIKYIDDYMVECVYYKNGNRYVETIHEIKLLKTDKPGLFKL